MCSSWVFFCRSICPRVLGINRYEKLQQPAGCVNNAIYGGCKELSLTDVNQEDINDAGNYLDAEFFL